MRPRVKICGVTRVEDALLAAELGAAAIGFIFWPGSPRYVDPADARVVAQALPPFVTAVGVFADQPVDDLRRVVETVKLGAVQLHGRESVADFDSLGCMLIKAVAVRRGAAPSDLSDIPAHITVLLDAHDPERLGGTGRTIDWAVAAGVAATRPVILSGGLRPENVAEAIRAVRPAAVDVASGVEREPGVKDATKLKAFFKAIAATPGE